MKHYVFRILRLILGVVVSAFGVYCTVQANVGLAPWDAFVIGITNVTGLTIGSANIAVQVITLLLAVLLKEKIGLGAVLNAAFIGVCLDLFYWIDILPTCQSMLLGIPMLLIGLAIIGIGAYFYMGAGFGCGPRDALTIGVYKHVNKLPFGVVRGALDAAVLTAGFVLKAKIGVGTVISACCLGLAVQLALRLFRLDVKSIRHESLNDTRKMVTALIKKA